MDLETPPDAIEGFLTVPDRWKEKDLEDFLWVNWEAIDFGFDRPIYLVGTQKRLSGSTSDRVDLLAKGRSGEHIAIELKIVEARRGDYTQLTSYMGTWNRAACLRTRCEESWSHRPSRTRYSTRRPSSRASPFSGSTRDFRATRRDGRSGEARPPRAASAGTRGRSGGVLWAVAAHRNA